MINVNTAKTLNIILPNTNKALSEVLKSITPKELETLSQAKDLKSIINGLLQQKVNDSSGDAKLLTLLKNNPTFKELSSVSSSIKELLQTLQKEKTTLPLEKQLKSFLSNMQTISESDLKMKIENSGVFLESKIKQLFDKSIPLSKPELLQIQASAKEIFSHDLKAILLKAHEELQNSSLPNRQEILKHIDKLTLQIDYHQLLSHLENATSLYIPYSWDALKDGNITIKSAKDDKFFTDIELHLKEYGMLKLRLGMFEKNQLNINITVESKELKKILQDNIPTLKEQLFGVNIVPVSIRFLDDDTALSSLYSEHDQELNAGFEVKV
ncbi:MAG: flagellar hook-length control protein FliK [Sulfurimonas sp.]|nr:flagellar hook-length control protein FliK [Sulfurimonas sp.]